MPRIFVIGGPNGAGKTTIAGGLLPEILACDEYVNADAIAKALSPFESDRAAFRAGRVMLKTIHDLADRQKDFAFETTMASRSFVPFLSSCRDRGYEINLLFLWLRSIALAQRRVAKRVPRTTMRLLMPWLSSMRRSATARFCWLTGRMASRSCPLPALFACFFLETNVRPAGLG